MEVLYPCGCVNTNADPSTVMRSVSKCAAHRRASGKSGLAYYLELGCIVKGIPQHAHSIGELTECLAELDVHPTPELTNGHEALEIGCGLGLYAPLLMQLGYRYTGLEPDPQAATWTSSTFNVVVLCETLETFKPTHPYSLIVAAHVMEHVPNSPEALARICGMLVPEGMLILIVPDDQDPVNPDHLWFYTPKTLQHTLEQAGYTDIRITIRRRVPHEQFIYATARRPATFT